MKKIVKKYQPEKAVYFSDFTNKSFKEFPPVTLTIAFGYGSKHDGTELQIHLTDEEYKDISKFLEDKMTKISKKYYKNSLKTTD